MKLTEKHKKLLWIAVAVFAVIHFLPRVAFFAHQAMQAQQQTPHKPPAGHPANVNPATNQPAPAVFQPLTPPGDGTSDQEFLRLRGNWMGSGLIANHGLCKAAFQLKLNPEKVGYKGYSTMSCALTMPAPQAHPTHESQQAQALAAFNEMAPMSTILTGQVQNGAIVFTVDQQIGERPDNCHITGVTATPFADQIALSWTAQGCPGGNLLLQRAPRS